MLGIVDPDHDTETQDAYVKSPQKENNTRKQNFAFFSINLSRCVLACLLTSGCPGSIPRERIQNSNDLRSHLEWRLGNLDISDVELQVNRTGICGEKSTEVRPNEYVDNTTVLKLTEPDLLKIKNSAVNCEYVSNVPQNQLRSATVNLDVSMFHNNSLVFGLRFPDCNNPEEALIYTNMGEPVYVRKAKKLMDTIDEIAIESGRRMRQNSPNNGPISNEE